MALSWWSSACTDHPVRVINSRYRGFYVRFITETIPSTRTPRYVETDAMSLTQDLRHKRGISAERFTCRPITIRDRRYNDFRAKQDSFYVEGRKKGHMGEPFTGDLQFQNSRFRSIASRLHRGGPDVVATSTREVSFRVLRLDRDAID